MSLSSGKEQLSPTFKTVPVKIIIPVVFTILLFILTIYLIMIPLIEKNMMATKREGIQHLTESAWSALQLFHDRAEAGRISRAEAQKAALDHFSRLRYGPEQADYFWINDMVPNMIMHPYRSDLMGNDVSGFKDPAGKHMFVEMVKTVEQDGGGFVDYLWQWKDKSDKIVAKISYVKAFQPWGWVVGTGIYVDDIREEIRAITRQVTVTCSGILMLFIVISAYIVLQGAKAKKEQMTAMEQTRLKEKQLVQADKMTSLGILVAGVAHEVNNPVTSIMLNAPNLKKAWQSFAPILDAHFSGRPGDLVCNMPYPELKNRIKMMLTAIEDSAARVKQIITELRNFSRPASKDFDRQVDMNEMVSKSMDLTRSLLKKATHHLTVTLDDTLPRADVNIQKIQQVIINLLVNACQALETPEQSIRLQTKNLPQSDAVRIIISDTGPGIALENLQKIKDPFFTTKRDDGGTGLGLSICEKIVNDHKGTLEFESAPGKGLTATLTLPVTQPGQEAMES